MDLPGYEDAYKLGYSLRSYSGNGTSATYGKESFVLTVNKDGTASLWSIVGLVEMEIKKFSFPHPKMSYFERMLLAVVEGADEAYQALQAELARTRGEF